MKKFLLLIGLIGLTQDLAGKTLDEMNWRDLLTVIGNEEWIDMFDALYTAWTS